MFLFYFTTQKQLCLPFFYSEIILKVFLFYFPTQNKSLFTYFLLKNQNQAKALFTILNPSSLILGLTG